MVYATCYKVSWRPQSKATRTLHFQKLQHRGVGEGATPFLGLLNFTLDNTLYCWVLRKEVSSTIYKVFGMTRPGIEPRSPGPVVNTLPTMPMNRYTIFWSFEIPSDNQMPTKKSDLVLVNENEKTCHLVDFAILAHRRMKI